MPRGAGGLRRSVTFRHHGLEDWCVHCCVCDQTPQPVYTARQDLRVDALSGLRRLCRVDDGVTAPLTSVSPMHACVQRKGRQVAHGHGHV